MNTLNFIDEKIKETKRSIEHWKELLKKYPNEETLTRCLNTREIELQAFQEVKTQLETWCVVQPNLKFEEHSHAWIYLDRITKDCPSYRVIEKELLKNTRYTTVVTKEGDIITVKLEVTNNE